jgi:hypothetical protein
MKHSADATYATCNQLDISMPGAIVPESEKEDLPQK